MSKKNNHYEWVPDFADPEKKISGLSWEEFTVVGATEGGWYLVHRPTKRFLHFINEEIEAVQYAATYLAAVLALRNRFGKEKFRMLTTVTEEIASYIPERESKKVRFTAAEEQSNKNSMDGDVYAQY